MHLIYAIADENNEIFYVGKTKNLDKRSKRHIYDAKRGILKYFVCRKINKLLSECKQIKFIILEDNLNEDNVDDKEIYYIKIHKDLGFTLCNLTDGGMLPHEKFGNYEGRYRKGCTLSEEVKEKIRQGNLGQKRSEETKQRLREAWKTRPPITDQTKEKLRASSIGKVNIKKYILTSPEGKKYITENGLTDFCRNYKLTPANLIKVLKGERHHHKGWTIRKHEEKQ